jgi:tetratricopeptide (TPR) repeat protein
LSLVYANRGLIYAYKEDWDQAIRDYTKAIELDSKKVWVYVRRGQAYYLRGVATTMAGNASQASRDNQQALDDYNRALELQDASSEIYIARSKAQAAAGNLDKALRDATVATTHNPGNAAVWNNLCWFGTLWGYATDVIDACDRAVTLSPTDARIRDSRGVARALLGNYTGAMEDFSIYLQWTKANGRYAQYRVKREGWLKELQTGRNPFDQQTLEALRNE